MKRLLLIICLLKFTGVFGFSLVSEKYSKSDFSLFYKGVVSDICYDKSDFKVVDIASHLLMTDIKKVTGIKPNVITSKSLIDGDVIIIGTLSKSGIINELVSKSLIDTSGLKGAWEKYSFQVIDNPWKKGTKVLVIVGSDRRGAAYGALSLSKKMGVSPWYWWADVPVLHKNAVFVKDGIFTEGSPDVKYRGIFINDEDWGMQPWSKKTFEPETDNIGPKTYAKICELMLRLRANYLWPAMHHCTGGFNEIPGNKEIADDYAIIMGSSHHEPLLYNNEGEWDVKKMGNWNYLTNKAKIYETLNKRVSQNASFENVYTIGMRGLGDHGLEGDLPIEKEIELTEQAIKDERSILEKNIGKDASKIPQVFVPYAEVLHLYNNGLKIPDDVTLMWVDDNYGYMRRLSNPIESKRSGGSGIYYHISYLGNPHEYTWLSTTNPALIYQELKKSYDYGADRIWMINVGDIKPAEYNTTLCMDLAWNIDTINYNNVYDHLQTWHKQYFGNKLGEKCAALMSDFYQINFERRPEFMGWGEEYSSVKWRERIEDTDYSFINYNEAQRRLSKFKVLSEKVTKLEKLVPKEYKSAFYELVYFPIKGSYYMNYKLLLAQKSRWYAKLGCVSTNDLVTEMKAYHDSTYLLTKKMESLENGKWKEMYSEFQSYGATFAYMPPYTKISVPEKADMGLIIEGNKMVIGVNDACVLPTFNSLYKETYFIDIYNKGKESFDWTAKSSNEWIKIDKHKGIVSKEQRVLISIDWSKINEVDNNGSITFNDGKKDIVVRVKAFAPLVYNADSLHNRYVEKNGYISIPLEKYQRSVSKEDVKWITKKGLGLTGASLAVESNKAISAGHWARSDDFAHVEYDIFTLNSGRFDIYTYTLPTFPVNGFELLRFAISIDDESPKTVYVGADIDSDRWRNNVRRNASIQKTSHYIDKPGKHTLKIFYLDATVVLDKAILDFGGLKKSYIGPLQTYVK